MTPAPQFSALTPEYNQGYTRVMKTAVSLPDDVFAEAEGVAKKKGISRSELYTMAIRAYLTATRDDRITEQLNEFYDSFEQEPDEFLQRAAEIELTRRDSW